MVIELERGDDGKLHPKKGEKRRKRIALIELAELLGVPYQKFVDRVKRIHVSIRKEAGATGHRRQTVSAYDIAPRILPELTDPETRVGAPPIQRFPGLRGRRNSKGVLIVKGETGRIIGLFPKKPTA